MADWSPVTWVQAQNHIVRSLLFTIFSLPQKDSIIMSENQGGQSWGRYSNVETPEYIVSTSS
jgi:hypothetical protein